jgi:hypothetical protein
LNVLALKGSLLFARTADLEPHVIGLGLFGFGGDDL